MISWKPEIIDFGYEPSTQTIKFVHTADSVVLVYHPDWIEGVVIDTSPSNGGSVASGTLTATVRADKTRGLEVGGIIVRCISSGVEEDYIIHTVFNYDSEHVLVSDVIDTVLLMSGDEGFIGPKDRIKANLAAKRWLQDNGGITGTNIRFAELEVDGNKVHLPADFVDYSGVYVVSSDGYLAPLYRNDDINLGQEPLLDENSFLLLDDAGFVISAHGLTPRVNNSTPYTYFGVDVGNLSKLGAGNKIVQITPGKLSGNGAYRYDKANRVIIIDGPSVKKIVLEYVSDPILRHRLKLDMGELRVHKSYQGALENFLYYKLIEINRHVPLYEKTRARTSYRLAMARAQRRALRMDELIQVLRGNR